jgi:hypothetical protein
MPASAHAAHNAAGIESVLNSAGILPLGDHRHAREATDDSGYGPAPADSLPAKPPVTVWSVMTPTTIPVLISSFAFAFLDGTLNHCLFLWLVIQWFN